MSQFFNYLVTNIFLVVISAIMIFISIFNFKQHKRTSEFILAITGIALFLSITEALEQHFKDIASVEATTVVAFLQYILRPVCVVLFIFLSNGQPKGKRAIVFTIPLMINFVIFLFAFIPGVKQYVFEFTKDGDSIGFGGGPLRFSSHIVGLLYLIYFLYVSVMNIKLKHISNAIIILVCVLLILSCVAIETFYNEKGDIHILNTGIIICVMSYYLFLFMERGKRDALTNLFNRSTYYQDLLRMEVSSTAVVQLDMNGLKYLNDSFGHEEGDKALIEISKIIAKRCNKNMYAYRLGGDEFIIIVNNMNEELIREIIDEIKEDLNKTKYSCSIGLAYRNNKNTSLQELIREAEKAMYDNKAEYYKTSKIERRK